MSFESRDFALRRAIEEIVEEILARARHDRRGQIYWCHPPVAMEGVAPRPLGPHLYAGTLGIVLFLVRAGRYLGTPRAIAIAVDALAPLRREIQTRLDGPETAPPLRQPIGGLIGLGSLIHGLIETGRAASDRSLIEDGLASVALLDSSSILEDQRLDVMTGTAGALLVLLASRSMAERTGQAVALLDARMSLCRERLDRARGSRGPGFCHGSWGVETAVLRHARWIGEPVLVNALEHPVIGLPDGWLRHGWCKGLSGWVIRHLAEGHERDLTSLKRVLEELATAPLAERDDLCCGNAGRIDILMFAAERLQAPALATSALELASRVVDRARGRATGYRLAVRTAHATDLRLFSGLAGVGHALLRTVATPTVPSPLHFA